MNPMNPKELNEWADRTALQIDDTLGISRPVGNQDELLMLKIHRRCRVLFPNLSLPDLQKVEILLLAADALRAVYAQRGERPEREAIDTAANEIEQQFMEAQRQVEEIEAKVTLIQANYLLRRGFDNPLEDTE
jgi:hypothetical protein